MIDCQYVYIQRYSSLLVMNLFYLTSTRTIRSGSSVHRVPTLEYLNGSEKDKVSNAADLHLLGELKIARRDRWSRRARTWLYGPLRCRPDTGRPGRRIPGSRRRRWPSAQSRTRRICRKCRRSRRFSEKAKMTRCSWERLIYKMTERKKVIDALIPRHRTGKRADGCSCPRILAEVLRFRSRLICTLRKLPSNLTSSRRSCQLEWYPGRWEMPEADQISTPFSERYSQY